MIKRGRATAGLSGVELIWQLQIRSVGRPTGESLAADFDVGRFFCIYGNRWRKEGTIRQKEEMRWEITKKVGRILYFLSRTVQECSD